MVIQATVACLEL